MVRVKVYKKRVEVSKKRVEVCKISLEVCTIKSLSSYTAITQTVNVTNIIINSYNILNIYA